MSADVIVRCSRCGTGLRSTFFCRQGEGAFRSVGFLVEHQLGHEKGRNGASSAGADEWRAKKARRAGGSRVGRPAGLMIEEKLGAVDEGPGEVLGAR